MTHVRAAWTRWLAGLSMVAVVVATAAAPSAAAEGEILGTGNPNAIENSYLVVLNDKTVHTEAGAIAARYGVQVEHTYQHAVRGFAGTMSEKAARQLAADPRVAYVEQNATVTLAGTQPNPPSWGLDRIDQRDLPMDGNYTYPNDGAGVRAYIIDTGIRVTHNDFGGRASWGTNTVGDGIDTDCHGHGTHVAGTAGGNSYGVAKGVALTAVKVLSCSGSGSWAGVIAGVDWLTGDHAYGPAVANMSLAGAGSNQALEDAVRASIADGVVYTIASANSSSDACNFTPARTPEAITVNASTASDTRAWFSNYGTCTDIVAPGENITSAWNSSDDATNTISGTSMAAPHVAGAAALILAENPGLDPQTVANVMYANATPDRITDPGPGSPNRLLFVAGGQPPPPADDHLVRGQGLNPGQFLRSQNGLYTLIMQDDGNLVLYDTAGQPLWHTNTWGYPGAYAIFQDDGNFVIYLGSWPLWHTNTWGTAASLFIVQNDSNIVLYGPYGEVYWHRFQ
jgi:subtilisin family serine protease